MVPVLSLLPLFAFLPTTKSYTGNVEWKGKTDKETRKCMIDSMIVEEILNKNDYKKNQLPGGSVLVEVEVWVQEVSKIDEYNSEFTLDVYVTEQWLDPNLAFDHLNPCKLNLSVDGQKLMHKIWTPRASFVNSKFSEVHTSPYKNVFLMFYSNGTVWLNYRVKLKGPCVKNLKTFPIDLQQCFLVYESFHHNYAEVQMGWSKTRPPILLLKEIRLPDYILINATTDEIQRLYHPGIWNELMIQFTFQRLYGFYVLQAYIPTTLSVLLSWVSFYLGAKHMAPRTALGVSSLLSLTFQFATISQGLPRSSEVKAIDVWVLTCMFFIFASLIELAIVGNLTRDRIDNYYTLCQSKKCCVWCSVLCLRCPLWTCNRIDTLSIFLFPILFGMFAFYYFFIYIS